MLGLVTMQTREEMALARIVSGKGVFFSETKFGWWKLFTK